MKPDFQPLVTVGIPSFNAARFIKPTLESLSAQTYKNIEVLLVDDASSDDTCAIVERHGFPSLRVIRNEVNRGCTHTIPLIAELARGEILIYLCHDDVLSPIAVERIVGAFRDPEIGATTRPYLFFEGGEIGRPYRVAPPLVPDRDVIVRADADYPVIHRLALTLGQASAMGFRKSMLKVPFSPDVFTVHVQAFLGVLRDHPVAAISDYILAIRTDTSQCRYVPNIYRISPLESWDQMLLRVFPDPRFSKTRRNLQKHIATTNDVGLVQVKCMVGQKALLREIWTYIKVWPLNAIRPFFIFWSLVTLITPSRLLRKTVDWLKMLIGRKLVGDVKLAGTSD